MDEKTRRIEVRVTEDQYVALLKVANQYSEKRKKQITIASLLRSFIPTIIAEGMLDASNLPYKDNDD